MQIWKDIRVDRIHQNGGGIFVLFYLLFLLIMGVPVLTMELAVGRASRQSTVKAYKTLEKPGSKWHIHGWVSIVGCLILMMYYTTVSGWMLGYFVKFATGTFSGMPSDQTPQVFSEMLADPKEMMIWMGITVLIGLVVCSLGLQNGIERITKVMMIGLLLLIVVLAVHSLTLDGAAEGLKFYLLPDFNRMVEVGVFDTIVGAISLIETFSFSAKI